MGIGLINSNNNSTTIGQYNDPTATSSLFEIGNGTSAASRSNAMTVLSNGNMGLGTNAPVTKLEVMGNARISNIPTGTLSDSIVTDSAGFVRHRTVSSLFNSAVQINNGLSKNGDSIQLGGALQKNTQINQGANTLAFNSIATTGTSHFTVDGTTFNVDAANNRVGIGTASPVLPLHVTGNSLFGTQPATTFYPLAPVNMVNSLPGGVKTQLNLLNLGAGSGAGSAIDFYTYDVALSTQPGSRIVGIDDNNYSNHFTFSTKVPGAPSNALAERMRISSNGNVGIGTIAPAMPLHVSGNSLFGSQSATTYYPAAPVNMVNNLAGAIKTQLNLLNLGGSLGAGSAIDFYTYDLPASKHPGSRITSIDDNNYSNHFTFSTKVPGAPSNALAERMRISSNGNVGIGTIAPAMPLHVSGNSLFGSQSVTTYYPAAPVNMVNNLVGAVKTQLNLLNLGGGLGAGSAIDFYTYDVSGSTVPGSRIVSIDDGNYSNHFTFSTKVPGAYLNSLAERLRIASNGNVGIGTSTPATQLHTTGTVRFEGAGSPGIGKVLTSDALGNASWTAIKDSTTASNGLTITGKNIGLGGALVGPTTISGLSGANKMSFIGTGIDAFNIDGTTLSVDASNDRVGIGTTSPSAKLQVKGQVVIDSLLNGAVTDSIVTADASGLLRKRTAASVLGNTWQLGGNTLTQDTLLGTKNDYPVRIAVNGSQRMMLDNKSNIIAGTGTGAGYYSATVNENYIDPAGHSNLIMGLADTILTSAGVGNMVSGRWNKVSGSFNILGGGQNVVNGHYNLVSGENNTNDSHGCLIAGGQNTNSSQNSVVAGYSNTNLGPGSMVAGYYNANYGNSNLVVGQANTVNSYASFTVGGANRAKNVGGNMSMLGLGLINSNENSTTIGKYNDSTASGSLFEIGNGTSATSRSNAMTVLSNGRVGIGTNGPGGKLHVSGDNSIFENLTTGGRAGFFVADGVNDVVTVRQSVSTIGNTFIGFENSASATIGSISRAGLSSISFNTTSDIRLKENIVATRYGLSDLMKIKVADYNFKADKSSKQTGFLAQQLYKIFPDAVTVGGEDASKKPWQVDYAKVTPLIVKSVQEQQVIIDQQQKQINSQQKQIEELKMLVEKLLKK